jgi:hypothetical protein
MLRSVRWNWTAGAPANSHNAWRRRMRKPRQESSSSIEPEAGARGPARGRSLKSTREAASNLVGDGKIRCAIYTRKSSEEGLEQEFNSLDAQREACEAYIKSQRHEGWSVMPQLYERRRLFRRDHGTPRAQASSRRHRRASDRRHRRLQGRPPDSFALGLRQDRRGV